MITRKGGRQQLVASGTGSGKVTCSGGGLCPAVNACELMTMMNYFVVDLSSSVFSSSFFSF